MTLPKGASPIVSNKPLWLASASPRRRDLLQQIGVTPDNICAANIDEAPMAGERPRELAERLAAEKLAAICANEAGAAEALVLAADTVVAIGRRVLPKAETQDEARACLALLSGRGHRVYTGLALADGGALKQRCVMTRVRFKRLAEDEIDGYIASGEWQGKAGGYAIQGVAATMISSLTGSYSNVVGLPLFETAALLRGAGYRINQDSGESEHDA